MLLIARNCTPACYRFGLRFDYDYEDDDEEERWDAGRSRIWFAPQRRLEQHHERVGAPLPRLDG